MNAKIISLIRKELTVEWRQRYALNGIILYVFASVFLVFLSVKMMNAPTWNAVFWIIMLFTSVNAITKSFISETRGHNLYYHSLCSPQQMILARIIYNSLLNIFLSALCLLIYSLLLSNPVDDLLFYCLAILLGSIGFAATFTLMSAIASKGGNSNLLMPVLSFPVIIPLLLVLIRASKKAMDGLDTSLLYSDLGVLLLINVMVVLLAYVLFPFLWKE